MLYTKTLLQISSLSIITETVKGSKLHALLKGPKINLKIARKIHLARTIYCSN